MTITVYGIKDKFRKILTSTMLPTSWHIFARKIFWKSTLLVSTRRSRLLNSKKFLADYAVHLITCSILWCGKCGNWTY